jgi:hypothetical protein
MLLASPLFVGQLLWQNVPSLYIGFISQCGFCVQVYSDLICGPQLVNRGNAHSSSTQISDLGNITDCKLYSVSQRLGTMTDVCRGPRKTAQNYHVTVATVWKVLSVDGCVPLVQWNNTKEGCYAFRLLRQLDNLVNEQYTDWSSVESTNVSMFDSLLAKYFW